MIRRRQRGQAAVIVALGGVTLIALVGLALDGGMAVGAYRHAQNAADAGALAAARQVYLNALTGATSNPTTLSPVASAEVQRNSAQLGETSGGATSSWDGGDEMHTADGMSISYRNAAAQLGWVFTGAQTTYVPNVGVGLTGQSALADVIANGGSLLSPASTSMQSVETTSNAVMALPASGGSTASSKVAVGVASAPSLGQNGSLSCWQSQAQYHAGQDTVGATTACGSGTMPSGVSMAGSLVSGYGTDARVYADDHPTAAPRVVATSVNQSDNGVTVAAQIAATGTTLDWDPVAGLSAASATLAGGVQVSYTPSLAAAMLSVSSSLIGMAVTLSVNAQGQTAVTVTCLPATLTVGGTLVGAVAATVNVNSSCSASGLNVAGVSVPSVQPAAASACSSNADTGVVTCQIQACFLRATLPTTPTATSVCIGENNLTLSGTPETTTSCCTSTPTPTATATPTATSSATATPTPSATATPTPTATATPASSPTPNPIPSGPTQNPWVRFSGEVTVTARVQQPTFFMGVLGWTQTTPSATATADVEAVVDEPAASFAASPFAMPDTAWTMGAGSVEEHLTVGHSYYLYGPAMQTNSPSLWMQETVAGTWEGQLAATSAHRVGATNTVTGASGLTTTPQPFLPSGAFVLEPIFNPVSGVIECYGAFVRVTGQQYWYTLVNSLPAAGGYAVQATSVPGWITFDEGAVSVKLVQ